MRVSAVLLTLLAGARWTADACVELDADALRCSVTTLDEARVNITRPERLQRLELTCSDRSHRHEQLDVSFLRGFGGLRSLAIHGCVVVGVGRGAFRHLRSLSALSLRTYGAEWPGVELELQPGAFAGVERLESLDLSVSGLRLLQRGVFASLTTLKKLNLTGNDLQDFSELLGAGISENLQILDVSHNRISELPVSAASFLPSLRELYINANELSAIQDGALWGLPRLEVLDVSDNQLAALPALMLNETRRLRDLRMQNNSIRVLPPGLLADLPHLLAVNISFNELSSLWVRGDAFSGLLRLVVLDLAGNRLETLSPEVFGDLSSLQVLDLSVNRLQSLPGGVFAALSNLHTLTLSDNLVSRLERRSLAGLRVLSRLSLDRNRLAHIDDEAFGHARGLTELQLQGNRLRGLPPALGRLPRLQRLDLGDNGVVSLPAGALQPLSHLGFLRLAGNRLANVSAALLAGQRELTLLDLSRNEISSVESGAFDGATGLQAVRLDANRLSNVNGLFAKLPALLWLNVSDNRIEFFDYALIPAELRWLDLRKNQLKVIGNFYNIESKIKLETLDLSHNQISSINRASVPDSIKYLILTSNQLTTVELGTFEAKSRLIRADLSSNQLSQLELKAITLPSADETKDKEAAEVLLAGNPFFCNCRMDWLHTINSILSRRKYPRVLDAERVMCRLLRSPDHPIPLPLTEPADFLCNYERHCFALCHCCNYVACDCEMKCPDGCSCYHDHTWNTNIVDCNSREQIAISREIPMDATALLAAGNNIRSLESHTFIGRKRIRLLYVNNSNVEEIQNRSLNGLSALQVLRLENNVLPELYGHEFDSLQSLRELYLHNNRLRTIHPSAFTKLGSLEVLTLSDNRLFSFPVWRLTSNRYLAALTLSANPWSCECAYMAKLTAFVADNAAKVEDGGDVRCSKTALGVASTCAPDEAHATESVTTGSSYTVTTGVSVVTPDAEKQFDVFVTYSAQDTRFVNEVLAPELEHATPAYRLCLLRRDAPSTSYLGDAVHHCVQASRRTLLVLSRNFLDNEWCRFDFKASHLDALETSRGVVVLLYGVERSAVEGELKTLLKSASCVRYGGLDCWRRLHRLLSPGRRCKNSLPRSVSDHACITCDRYSKNPRNTMVRRDSPMLACSALGSQRRHGEPSSSCSGSIRAPGSTSGGRPPHGGSCSSLQPSEHTYVSLEQYGTVDRTPAESEMYATLEPAVMLSGPSDPNLAAHARQWSESGEGQPAGCRQLSPDHLGRRSRHHSQRSGSGLDDLDHHHQRFGSGLDDPGHHHQELSLSLSLLSLS
ncbi:toll-like receptor Tollo, partial [Pollicipes pollicipes]|uniref:toll-like receptor Tollo n=1 Tax=Pollicipes pollicipes TaxID=41117 RepID=UPI001884F16B